jgi:hypothetical protein
MKRLNYQSNPKQSAPSARLSVVLATALILLILAALPATTRASSTSTLTIASEDQNGNSITGLYNVLTFMGQTVASGYSPNTYTVNTGQGYLITAENFGSCNFAYWAGINSASPTLYLSVSGTVTLTAIYNCSGSLSSVTVASTTIGGAPVTGLYAVLFDSNGNLLSTGFTSMTFNTTPGQSYWIQADNFGTCTFIHWTDMSTANPRLVTATDSAQVYTAVYACLG